MGRRVLRATIIVVTGCALGGLVATSWTAVAVATPSCSSLGVSPQYVPSSEATSVLQPANQRTNSPPTITFTGSNGDQQIAPYEYTVVGPFPNLTGVAWGLSLISGNERFPKEDAAVTLSDNLGTVEVSICLRATGVPAGSYSGSLGLAGGGIKPVQLPLTVNIKYAGWPLIFFGMTIAVLLGVFVKWWMSKIAEAEDNEPKLSQYFTWLWRQKITVLIAAVGASYGVYQSKYIGVDSFVRGDVWGLWVATGVAVAAASLLTTTIGTVIQPDPAKKASAPAKSQEGGVR